MTSCGSQTVEEKGQHSISSILPTGPTNRQFGAPQSNNATIRRMKQQAPMLDPV
jgi:hypothetical protein